MENRTFTFHTNKPNTFVLSVLFVFMMFPLLIPFVVLFFEGFSIGTLISFMVFWVIASYFVRMFLWNWKGKELLDISEEDISQTIDYAYYKEVNRIPNKAVSLILMKERKQIKEPQILDNEWTGNNEQMTIKLTSENETIELHSKVSKATVKQISDLLIRMNH